MKSGLVSQLASVALLVFMVSLLPSLVVAATLDGGSAQSLLSNRDMASKNVAGEGSYYWTWRADGSVCMRLMEKNGPCADEGKWKVAGDRVCYEFTWWGKSSGFGAACFRINELGRGRYEALQDNGLMLFEFTVNE